MKLDEDTITGLQFLCVVVLLFGAPPLFYYLHKFNRKKQAASQPILPSPRPCPPITYNERPTTPQPTLAVAAILLPPAPALPAGLNIVQQTIWDWLVWSGLEFYPHTMLVGASGDGKTTMARALIASRSNHSHQFIIIDPHSEPQKWGRLHSYGGAENMAEIELVLGQILQEYETRLEKMRVTKGMTGNFAPLTILVDEWPVVKMDCPSAATFMKRLVRGGRKVNMHLIILTQSAQVETLGLKGEKDTRVNFVSVYLRSMAREYYPKLFLAQVVDPGGVAYAAAYKRPVVVGLVGRAPWCFDGDGFINELANSDVSPSLEFKLPLNILEAMEKDEPFYDSSFTPAARNLGAENLMQRLERYAPILDKLDTIFFEEGSIAQSIGINTSQPTSSRGELEQEGGSIGLNTASDTASTTIGQLISEGAGNSQIVTQVLARYGGNRNKLFELVKQKRQEVEVVIIRPLITNI